MSAPRRVQPFVVVSGPTRRIMVAPTATDAFAVLRGVPPSQLAEVSWARPALRPDSDKTWKVTLQLWHDWGLTFAAWNAGLEALAVANP